MNLDLIIVAIIAAVPPTIVAGVAVYQALKTHDLVNHRMDELLELARTEARAQAVLDEKASEHLRKLEAVVLAIRENGARNGH